MLSFETCALPLKPIYKTFMKQIQTNITSNNGYLGSRIDEDRSEFRYLMRIAELVNHQTVERILHFFKREVSLFECVLTSLAPVLLFGNSYRTNADSEVYSRVSEMFLTKH